MLAELAERLWKSWIIAGINSERLEEASEGDSSVMTEEMR